MGDDLTEQPRYMPTNVPRNSDKHFVPSEYWKTGASGIEEEADIGPLLAKTYRRQVRYKRPIEVWFLV